LFGSREARIFAVTPVRLRSPRDVAARGRAGGFRCGLSQAVFASASPGNASRNAFPGLKTLTDPEPTGAMLFAMSGAHAS
jgi:hypothetical protein